MLPDLSAATPVTDPNCALVAGPPSPENKARNRRTEFDVEEQDGKKPEGYTEPCAPTPAHDKK